MGFCYVPQASAEFRVKKFGRFRQILATIHDREPIGGLAASYR